MAKKSTLYIITKSVWGGAAKYVYDLATHLSKDEFEINIAAGGQDKFAQKIIEAGLPYFEIKNFQRKVHFFKEFLAFFEILKLLFKLKPDIVHVNSSKAGGLAGLATLLYKILYKIQNTKYRARLRLTKSRRAGKIQIIFTAHGWAFNEERSQWQINLIKFFSKMTALFYDKIICVSEYDRQIALKNKIAPASKLITIYNGLDIKSIDFLAREKARQKLLPDTKYQTLDTIIIGTIAEWNKNKGLFYLLRALMAIKDKEFDIVLIGSGENTDKEKMYDFVKKRNLENVHLIEWIDKAATYLKAFDIFVLPSIKEGLPYTILEAMAAEVPIIATRVGGIPKMIKNNLSGLLIAPRNPALLAEKIIFLLEHPQLAKSLAQKARERVKKEFSLEKMIRETKMIYEKS